MDANDRRSRAAAEAAEWWVRIEAEELSREEREQFVDWLRESAVHVAEMLRMAEVHGALERFQDWGRVPAGDDGEVTTNVLQLPAPAARADRLRSWPSPVNAGPAGGWSHSDTLAGPGNASNAGRPGIRRLRWMAGLALAASVAALGVFLAFFFDAQVIETGRAERRSVTLADGSVLQIDPESRLRIRLRTHERDVSLERGRALFRVARDPARPFVVRADDTLVRAVGTQFGVEQAREAVVVTVAEGKVAVRPRGRFGLPFGFGSEESRPRPMYAPGSADAASSARAAGSAERVGAAHGAGAADIASSAGATGSAVAAGTSGTADGAGSTGTASSAGAARATGAASSAGASTRANPVTANPPPAGRSVASVSAAATEVLLTAGQQVIVPRHGPAQAVRTVDTDRELAWVAGRLVFDNESVADVIEEFNRYNVVQLHVASPELARRSVSGVFDASEPESFIGFMRSVAPVHVRRAGQDITIALAP